jgi:hemerythrin
VSALIWTGNLNTGIDVIDTQHRCIVVIINRLRAAKRRGDTAALGPIIEELVDYTMSHFAFEETLMEDAGYPLAHGHKRLHDLMARHVREFRERFHNGDDVTDELNTLVSRWLFDHILNIDAAYVEPVRAQMRELVRDRRNGGWLARSLRRCFGQTPAEHVA